MKAFTNTPITKEKLLEHLKWHQEQDAFLKGVYHDEEQKEFKGCAVGCSIHSINLELGKDLHYDDHALYEEYFGIPEWLAHLEDTLFENLSIDRSKIWPIEFIEAINVGSDLNKIKPVFLVYVLESVLKNVQEERFKKQRKAVENCIELWKRDDIGSEGFAKAARSAAASAARSADASAADSAAWSAARSAARSAVPSSWSAARSTSYAVPAACSATYEDYANELLRLMRECQ